MKKILYILFIGAGIALIDACSEDGFPVPLPTTEPNFSFTINGNGFAPATVIFINETIVPARAGDVSFTWSFGDGTSSDVASPTHIYETPGSYKVNLVVITSESLEVNEISKDVVIKDPNATGVQVYFTDGGTVYSSLITIVDPIVAETAITTLGDSYGMAVDTVNDKLYIADYDTDQIFIANLDGSGMVPFRTNIGSPDGVAIDYDNEMIYWDTADGIRRTSMTDTDVSHFEDFVTGLGAIDPEGIAIDAVNEVLYWNNYDGGLWKKNLNGTGEGEIIPGLGGGSVIVVGDRIFFDSFIATDDTHIKSANLDGSGVETVATSVTAVVYGLAYDKDGDKVYWVDRDIDIIRRADPDGSNAEVWYEGISARGLSFGKKI